MIFRSEPVKVKFANGRQCFSATISPTKRKELEARFKSKITSVTGAPKTSSSNPAKKKSGRTYPTGSAWQKEHHNYNPAEKSERKPADRKKPARNVKKKAELGAKVDDDISSMSDSELAYYLDIDEKDMDREDAEYQARELQSIEAEELYKTGGKTKRKRRTKAEIAHDIYAADVMSYKWFIVDLEKNRAIDGYEHKEDAVETLEGDFGKFPKEQKTHKLMSERSLKTAGIENPKPRWTKADWAQAGMKTLDADKISTSLNVPANYIKDHKGVGGLIAATLALYVGYKIGRMRPQKMSFETEKKVGKAIGKGAAAAGRATAKGAKKAGEIMSKAGERAQASYAARAMKEGGKTTTGYIVFNYTDNIEASAETFKTKKAANDFIKEFRKRYEKQGYYKTNNWEKINPEHIDLEVIPADFNPYN